MLQNSTRTINPFTQTQLREFDLLSDKKVNSIINEMNDNFHIWRKTSFEERNSIVKNIKNDLETNKEKYAKLITSEMGKPISESLAEVSKCAALCDYYITNGKSQLEDIKIKTSNKLSFVSFQPLGVILAIMPWNFPLWQVFRFAIPTIMAGNVCLLKHASNVSGCSVAIENIFNGASRDICIFKSLIIKSSQVENVIANRLIKGVTLTGSVEVGRIVASQAGKHLKKCVMELGGNDPYIVLKDADISLAAKICAKSKMINGGQTCISAKRFIIVEDVYDEFLEKFKKEMSSYTPENPMNESCKLGTMVSIEARDNIHKQVLKALENGAKYILGGKISSQDDAFYPATILTDVKTDNPIFDEEIFGPVAIVYKVKNEQEAIQLANNSSFGLGGAIFSRDETRATEIARNELAVGNCVVNDFVRSDPALPFGGINDSGFGRELSEFGIREFTNIKTIVVN